MLQKHPFVTCLHLSPTGVLKKKKKKGKKLSFFVQKTLERLKKKKHVGLVICVKEGRHWIGVRNNTPIFILLLRRKKYLIFLLYKE